MSTKAYNEILSGGFVNGVYVNHALSMAARVEPDVFSKHSIETRDSEDAIRQLQDVYYPEAWMFIDKSRPIGEWPDYRPVCSTPAELALAYALRPDGIIGGPVLDMRDRLDSC